MGREAGTMGRATGLPVPVDRAVPVVVAQVERVGQIGQVGKERPWIVWRAMSVESAVPVESSECAGIADLVWERSPWIGLAMVPGSFVSRPAVSSTAECRECSATYLPYRHLDAPVEVLGLEPLPQWIPVPRLEVRLWSRKKPASEPESPAGPVAVRFAKGTAVAPPGGRECAVYGRWSPVGFRRRIRRSWDDCSLLLGDHGRDALLLGRRRTPCPES